MKFSMLLFLTTLSLFGFSDKISSFSADFEQKIMDEKKNTLSYQGHVWANKKNQALWEYRSPIEKKVFIQNGTVQIVEDDLEQVIIKKLHHDIDFFQLLKKAKKITDSSYKAEYLDNTYTIYLDKNTIDHISYVDNFSNQVEIIFTNQKQNSKIDNNIFLYTIPSDYDVLRE